MRHRSATLEAALRLGAVDEAYEQPLAAVRDADLVVLCTPVGLLGELLGEIAGGLAPGAVVTDVGSTKASVVAAADRACRRAFTSSAPTRWPAARSGASSSPGPTCLTGRFASPRRRKTDGKALAEVEAFWRTLGLRTTRLSPAEHDRLLADVSHLPHAVAAAIVSMQHEAALKLSGKGFADLTRIAAGDPGLWRRHPPGQPRQRPRRHRPIDGRADRSIEAARIGPGRRVGELAARRQRTQAGTVSHPQAIHPPINRSNKSMCFCCAGMSWLLMSCRELGSTWARAER